MLQATKTAFNFWCSAVSFRPFICPCTDSSSHSLSKSLHGALISVAWAQLSSHATIVNCEIHKGSVA